MSTLTEMVMAVSMAAMMAPSAAPFFIAYGRDTRRPAAVGIAVAIYAAVWVLIGLAVNALMGVVMMPASVVVDAAAIALAIAYVFTPWSRATRARCVELCGSVSRHGALTDGLMYAACCVACTAGIMVALVVVGMNDLLVVVAGAAVMLVYKLSGWGELVKAR